MNPKHQDDKLSANSCLYPKLSFVCRINKIIEASQNVLCQWGYRHLYWFLSFWILGVLNQNIPVLSPGICLALPRNSSVFSVFHPPVALLFIQAVCEHTFLPSQTTVACDRIWVRYNCDYRTSWLWSNASVWETAVRDFWVEFTGYMLVKFNLKIIKNGKGWIIGF